MDIVIEKISNSLKLAIDIIHLIFSSILIIKSVVMGPPYLQCLHLTPIMTVFLQ